MDALNLNLTGMSLAEWGAMDAQWYYEAEAAQTSFRQGQKARQDADSRQRQIAG